MVLHIKSSLNGLAALKKLGLSEFWGDWLISNNVEVKLTSTGFTFIAPNEPDKASYVPMSLNDLQKLNAGTLTATQKGIHVSALVACLNLLKVLVENPKQTAQSHADPLGASVPFDIEGSIVSLILEESAKKSGAMGKLPGLKITTVKAPAQDTPVQVTASEWPAFPKEKMKTGTRVPLISANMMYQPVIGTSSNSRYFVVGGNKDVRVAAKYAKGILSLRIESKKFDDQIKQIQGGGFNTSSDKTYASLHLTVGADQTLARKSLGAVLLGLGMPLDTPMPNLDMLV